MSSSFSWTDTLHIAVNNCLSCLRTVPSDDSLNNHLSTHRPDDLRALLVDPENDAETLSLRSNPGSITRNKRKTHRGRITIFGLDLFGRAPTPAVHLTGGDDVLYHDPVAPALTAHSSLTFDSDAAPLDSATIENLSSSIASTLAHAEGKARGREERKRRRKERKEMKKAAQILALSGDGEFEGFQGSGDGYPGTLSNAEERASQTQFLSQRLPSPTSLVPHLAIKEEEEDESADLDGVAYARRRPARNGSNDGSDSRSRTSASMSDRLNVPGNSQFLLSGADFRALPSTSASRKKRSHLSHHLSSRHHTSTSHSSNSNSNCTTTSDSTSLASPVSPPFYFDGQPNVGMGVTTVVSPTTSDQAQGFFDLEGQKQANLDADPQVKHPPSRESFPSTGLRSGSGYMGNARGAFLANTSSGERKKERKYAEDAMDGLF